MGRDRKVGGGAGLGWREVEEAGMRERGEDGEVANWEGFVAHKTRRISSLHKLLHWKMV